MTTAVQQREHQTA
jgi:hypothetical protein